MSRVLVLRSSRHLEVALRATAARWPSAQLMVVCQPGHETEVVTLDRGPRLAVFPYSRITPWTWMWSKAAWGALAWRPDEVVVQLPAATIRRSWLLGVVAIMAGRGAFWCVLPDGRMIQQPAAAWLGEMLTIAPQLLLNCTLISLVAVIAVCAWPSYVWARLRRPGTGRA